MKYFVDLSEQQIKDKLVLLNLMTSGFHDANKKVDELEKRIIVQREIIEGLYEQIELWKGAYESVITKYAKRLLKDM